MTDDLVERVARAICDEMHIQGKSWGGLQRHKLARAAIAAMREPTEAQLKAVQEWPGQQSYTDIWQAMIDAALKEEKPKREWDQYPRSQD